jgi:hypothetical protein
MILSFEGGSSRSHYVEESFWRRLWTCRQTEYGMNEWMESCAIRRQSLVRLSHSEGLRWFQLVHFLGAFAESRKAPITIVMSTRPPLCTSVRMYQRGPPVNRCP